MVKAEHNARRSLGPIRTRTVVVKRVRRKLTPYERASVAAGQGWRCQTCRALFKALWHVDHVTPLVDGGADSRGNMQALCAECHADKTAAEARERGGSRDSDA